MNSNLKKKILIFHWTHIWFMSSVLWEQLFTFLYKCVIVVFKWNFGHGGFLYFTPQTKLSWCSSGLGLSLLDQILCSFRRPPIIMLLIFRLRCHSLKQLVLWLDGVNMNTVVTSLHWFSVQTKQDFKVFCSPMKYKTCYWADLLSPQCWCFTWILKHQED